MRLLGNNATWQEIRESNIAGLIRISLCHMALGKYEDTERILKDILFHLDGDEEE